MTHTTAAQMHDKARRPPIANAGLSGTNPRSGMLYFAQMTLWVFGNTCTWNLHNCSCISVIHVEPTLSIHQMTKFGWRICTGDRYFNTQDFAASVNILWNQRINKNWQVLITPLPRPLMHLTDVNKVIIRRDYDSVPSKFPMNIFSSAWTFMKYRAQKIRSSKTQIVKRFRSCLIGHTWSCVCIISVRNKKSKWLSISLCHKNEFVHWSFHTICGLFIII